jgi:hypothetical protein
VTCPRIQRQLSEPFPRLPDRARLELQLLGAAKHLGRADRLSRKLMCNLRRIDSDLMEPQQQCQTV